MESYGNEIRVQQGEDWNLDKLLSASNREYIPYIISDERTNPYFVITVASTKYEKNLRYVKSWWCSIKDSKIPTFSHTNPILCEVESEEALNALTPTAVNEIVSAELGVTWDEGELVNDKKTRYLYYDTIKDENDVVVDKIYFYFEYTYDEGTSTWDYELIKGYECHVRMNFASKDTSEWGSQNYLYQISLVSGQTMRERLQEIYEQYTPENWPEITIGMTDEEIQETIEAQYKYVKVNYPNELQPDIDIDSPLGYIDTPETILQPTKLEVYNNLRKLI